MQIQTSCYHSTIYGVIWKITAHQFCSRAPSRSQGSHSRQGGVTSALGVNDRGVTHAGESFTPLTPDSDVDAAQFLHPRGFTPQDQGYSLITEQESESEEPGPSVSSATSSDVENSNSFIKTTTFIFEKSIKWRFQWYPYQ